MIDNKEAEYEALFLKLAAFLGWTNILLKNDGMMRGVFGSPPEALAKEYAMNEGQRTAMPNWIAKNHDAFSLMGQFGIYPRENGHGSVCAGDRENPYLATTIIGDHDDIDEALRYVIVAAVVAKLEKSQKPKSSDSALASIQGDPEVQKGALGVRIDLDDADGNPICIGDTLLFDEEEWGGECVFVMRFDKGEILHPGGISDLGSFCTIIKKWDGSDPINHSVHKPPVGVYIGIRDSLGNPIHIGDTIALDEEAFSGNCRLKVVFENGEILPSYRREDISEFGTIVQK